MSLIEFFLGGGGGGELWIYVHHTVDVKILCSDVVRRSGCPFIFSTLTSLVHLNTGSINLLVSRLSVRLSVCLSVCLSIIYPSVILLLMSALYLLQQ